MRCTPAIWGDLPNGRTQIYSVSYKEVEKNVYEPVLFKKINTKPVRTSQLDAGKSYNLAGGGKLSVKTLNTYENDSKTFGVGGATTNYSGVKIKLNYQNEGKEVAYTQTYTSSKGEVVFDASEHQNPFYFYEHLKNGNFEDQNASSGVNEVTSHTFNLTIYERDVGSDTYKATGVLEYSYDVTFDDKGKGKVSNFKQKFTDISGNE